MDLWYFPSIVHSSKLFLGIGMLGFMWMVGTRAYLMVHAEPWNVNAVHADDEASTLSMSWASLSMVASSFLLMVSVVNRGVANGGGQVGDSYGGSVFNLFSHYLKLLFKQATGIAVSPLGPLEILSLLFAGLSLVFGVKAVFIEP